MTSRSHQMAEKHPPFSQSRTPAQLQDVKLKDRIHLFEGLSNQSAVDGNKNMSANNSEQARYSKVISPEHKRQTQVETDIPAILRCGQNEPPRSPVSPGVKVSAAADRSKFRSKTLTRPSQTATNDPQFTFSDVEKSKPGLPSKVADKTQTQSDIVYVDGVPVQLRNGRKCSADYPEARSTVFAMIRNFETKGDTGEAERCPNQNGAPQDEIPGERIQRKSAELNQLIQENEVRTKPMPQLTKLHRRRSKSFSNIHSEPPSEVASVPKPFIPPSKPKRTYDHDIYVESKALMKLQQQQKQNGNLKDSKLVNPLYEIGPVEEDKEDGDKHKERSLSESPIPDAKTPGRYKELPPVPNIPPYTPPLRRPRNQTLDNRAVKQNSTVSPSPDRPRSEATLVSSQDRHPTNSLTHSHSSEDLGKATRTSGYLYHKLKLLRESQEHKCVDRMSDRASNYDQPIFPLFPQSKTDNDSDFNEPEPPDAVIDADGYSIPGSHLWKTPEPHIETKKPTGFLDRVMSFKAGVNRFSEPNSSWRSVRIYEPGRGRLSVPGLGVIEDIVDEDEEMLRKISTDRKTSTDRKISIEERAPSSSNAYAEPGSHVVNDIGPEPSVRHRSRLITMRRKIDDAFHRRQPRNPRNLQEDDRSSVTSEDSGDEVNDAVTRKRVTRVRAMKKHSSVYCKVDKNLRNESKLYDYLLVISLEYNEVTRRYHPVEKYRYPSEISATQNDRLRAIPHFCFPDAFKWAPVERYNSESYSFVLTSVDGSRLYGYNRRLLPPGDKPRLPEVYCIITPISCRMLYTQLLDGIEQRRHSSEQEMLKLIKEAHTRVVPTPGGHINIMVMSEDGDRRSTMRPLKLERPKDSRLEHVDFDCLFNALEIPQVIQVFASLLFERRIIMFSGQISKLSKCSQAAAALLYPFAWQHVYVPVLPEKLIDMSCSPTPYIMGMLALCIPNVELLPIEEALLVDLDSRDFYTCVGDEDTILPKKLSQALGRALREICKSFTEEDDSFDETKNRAISEVFIRYFVETCGHYVSHFTSDYQGNLKFDRESFIAAVPSRSIRRFLEVFTETQMFSLFIQEKEAESEGIEQGLFELRVREWEAQCKLNANKLGARVRKIGKAVKDISREGGKKMADVRTKVKANLDSKV